MNFPRFWARGYADGFSAWRWSNTSMQEALDSARQTAERLSRAVREGRKADRYGYGERPLREPVLREFRDTAGGLAAVVTRNSYGCQVLNASRALFVDVDLPEASSGSSGGGLLSRLFGGAAPASRDPQSIAIGKAEDWARRHPGWNWRIYRTAAGLRLLATHALFDPADAVCEEVFSAVDADPLYRKLCRTQECFRARLTPKPWRCNLPNPPVAWPFESGDSEAAHNDWEARYNAVARNKSTCALLSAGDGRVHPELQPLVALHDEMTRATSPMPLA